MSKEIEAELARMRGEIAQLRRATDVQEIVQLVMSYGPLVDSGDARATAALWDEDGSYVVDDLVTLQGRDALVDMVTGEMHQEIITGGAAHVLTVPRVVVSDDGADAFNHCLLLRARDGEFAVARASACHWELRRSESGWKVVRRTNRLLNGQSAARELFARLATL